MDARILILAPEQIYESKLPPCVVIQLVEGRGPPRVTESLFKQLLALPGPMRHRDHETAARAHRMGSGVRWIDFDRAQSQSASLLHIASSEFQKQSLRAKNQVISRKCRRIKARGTI